MHISRETIKSVQTTRFKDSADDKEPTLTAVTDPTTQNILVACRPLSRWASFSVRIPDEINHPLEFLISTHYIVEMHSPQRSPNIHKS